MDDLARKLILGELSGAIDIPDSAYEKAEARYKDLGEWFGHEGARCCSYSPHIYPQGSFRLGTVIRPIDDDGEYDLDIGCRLREGIRKTSHTQKQLKELVGSDLEDYRVARGIKEKIEEKHRCWRLKYADILKFHLDTVPSIPETTASIQQINEALMRSGAHADLAKMVSDLTGAITDNRNHLSYCTINNDWKVSNSEGFALWFESRMKLAQPVMESIALQAKMAKIDKLPAYRWKSALQRAVQLLKRHRDITFSNDPDGKPASIIITTLSAKAYQGEVEVSDALDTILSSMGALVNKQRPRVPNPVNPAEDFTDRWSEPGLSHHRLEAKFWYWLQKAKEDFGAIGKERKLDLILESAKEKFGASLNTRDLNAKLEKIPSGGLLKAAAVSTGLSFPDKPLTPKKPAGFA